MNELTEEKIGEENDIIKLVDRFHYSGTALRCLAWSISSTNGILLSASISLESCGPLFKVYGSFSFEFIISD